MRAALPKNQGATQVDDGYLSNPDQIHEGYWVDTDVDKWVKICRALKEAGKTDSFYFKQGQKVVGEARLNELLGD